MRQCILLKNLVEIIITFLINNGKSAYGGLPIIYSAPCGTRFSHYLYYLHLNEAQTVSDASCAQMPEISIWSALHFLSSLYTQLEASHEMLRLILGDSLAFLLFHCRLRRNYRSMFHHIYMHCFHELRLMKGSSNCLCCVNMRLHYILKWS